MINYNDIRHGRHCTFIMHVHLVFVTKHRRKAFNEEVRKNGGLAIPSFISEI